MKIIAEKLIDDLKSHTHEFISFSETLRNKPVNQLNWKFSPTSWSVLECLEHLNLYGDFYIPEIQKVISASKSKQERVFKSGFIGEYFASSMLPKEKLNKMKTFSDKNPLNSNLSLETIHRFIRQQNEFLELLEKAKAVNLNKVKTSITLTKLIKLKLGDTLRFVVNHNIRHFEQIKNVMKSQLN